MKILVTGGKGQLGWELSTAGERYGFDIVSVDLPEFDITDRLTIKKAITNLDISVVVNAAAYTAVDQAESEPEIAFGVNQSGPAHLATCCAEAGIPLIHISTDYVFDGRENRPYTEIDPVSPLGIYGKSKAEGEKEVKNRLAEYIILRTSWLYGAHGNNFVKTMLRRGHCSLPNLSLLQFAVTQQAVNIVM